jgi:hypothetical protein
MGVYAVFDTVGMQSYIFSSNKMSENVGASTLVRKLLRNVLPEIVKERNGLSDWESRLGSPLDKSAPCEIVYSGGGNAYVAFRDVGEFNIVSEKLLRKAYALTHSVGIAVAAVETDFGDSYKADFARLNERLQIAKGSINHPVPAGNQPITRASARTGLPVTDSANGEWVDKAQSLKSKADESRMDFETLGSMIGIVCVDGNNIGDSIAKSVADAGTYDKAVPRMRELSKKISEAFGNARDIVNSACKSHIDLVTDGDDTAAVIKGELAISYAAELLRQIEKQPSPFESGAKLTACAGVSIVHSHFPFSAAYTLAEDACGIAKKTSRSDPGSYIDFHLHQSGMVLELSELRKRQYTIGGAPRYARPWKISGNAENVPDFAWFEERQHVWARESKSWPRTRLKDLRNALSISNEEALLVLGQCASRGYKLLDFDMGKSGNLSESDKGKLSWYFDVLELADVYGRIVLKDKEVR